MSYQEKLEENLLSLEKSIIASRHRERKRQFKISFWKKNDKVMSSLTRFCTVVEMLIWHDKLYYGEKGYLI